MGNIEEMITNAPPEVEKNKNIVESKYTFTEVKEAISDFVKINRIKGYLIYFDFPNLLRISRGDLRHIVGEFTPIYVSFKSPEFKDDILSNPRVRKYRNYLLGQVRLEKVNK
jgi:hypothetical protein